MQPRALTAAAASPLQRAKRAAWLAAGAAKGLVLHGVGGKCHAHGDGLQAHAGGGWHQPSLQVGQGRGVQAQLGGCLHGCQLAARRRAQPLQGAAPAQRQGAQGAHAVGAAAAGALRRVLHHHVQQAAALQGRGQQKTARLLGRRLPGLLLPTGQAAAGSKAGRGSRQRTMFTPFMASCACRAASTVV